MSLFDHPDTVPTAPSWRCPHCGQLQAESTRCWRCDRSAVTCSTCHRFRASVADELGYCVRGGARTPLSGDEVHPCWEAAPATHAAPGLFVNAEPQAPPPRPAPRPRPRRPLKAPKPPVEDVRAAAWAEPPGDLVDAPHVEPGSTITTEVERRRRPFWRR